MKHQKDWKNKMETLTNRIRWYIQELEHEYESLSKKAFYVSDIDEHSKEYYDAKLELLAEIQQRLEKELSVYAEEE